MTDKCYAIIFGTLIFADEGGCAHALLLASKIVLTFHSTLRCILVTTALRIGVSHKAYEVRHIENGPEFIVGIVCWVLKWYCQVKASKCSSLVERLGYDRSCAFGIMCHVVGIAT